MTNKTNLYVYDYGGHSDHVSLETTVPLSCGTDQLQYPNWKRTEYQDCIMNDRAKTSDLLATSQVPPDTGGCYRVIDL